MVATFIGPGAAAPCYTLQDINDRSRKPSPKPGACQEISDLLVQVVENGDQYSFGGGVYTLLPSLPGLSVENIGHITLPLPSEDAPELISKCSKIRDNVWELSPDQIQLTNPEWARGLELLCKLSSRKLGYQHVVLRPELARLLIYRPGGCLPREQDLLEDRVAARLVVQLPSEYTGGNLTVLEEKTNKPFCYTFGKEKGMRGMMPHYAVFTAGAYRTVGMVLSGYRLVLVYSLCVPPEAPFVLGKTVHDLLREKISEAIGRLVEEQRGVDNRGFAVGDETEEDDNKNALLALKLTMLCTKKRIEATGVHSLQGKDRNRYHTLSSANALLPPERQLNFVIACYTLHKCKKEPAKMETLTWYTLDGKMLGVGICFAGTRKFCFVNPDQQTWGQLIDDCECDAECECDRFVVVGWPASADFKKTLAVMGIVAATTFALCKTPTNMSTVRNLLKYQAEQGDNCIQRWKPVVSPEPESSQTRDALDALSTCPALRNIIMDLPKSGVSSDPESAQTRKPSVTLSTCQTLCNAIMDFGDAELVHVFLTNFFVWLQQKHEFVPQLARLISRFGWESLKFSFLAAFDQASPEDIVQLVIELAEALHDIPPALSDLSVFACEKAHSMVISSPTTFVSGNYTRSLWKMACKVSLCFTPLVAIFNEVDGELLDPIVESLLKSINSSSPQQHQLVWVSLASRRCQWLIAEVAKIEKFSWTIPVMDFPDAAQIALFLAGPNESLVIRGFNGIAEARDRVNQLRQKIVAPLTMTAQGRGHKAFVRIVKGDEDTSKRKQLLAAHKEEIGRLKQLMFIYGRSNEDGENVNNENAYGGSSQRILTTTGRKRPREEASEGFHFEVE